MLKVIEALSLCMAAIGAVEATLINFGVRITDQAAIGLFSFGLLVWLVCQIEKKSYWD